MTRFALTVTAIEIFLTLAASVFITLHEAPEPFLTKADLNLLNLPCDNLRNERISSLQALYCYETRGALAEPRQSVYVSYRVEVGPADYDSRRQKELELLRKREAGEGTLIDEPFDGEKGYSLRHQGPTSVRFEQCRARGRDMLIIRMTQDKVSDVHGRIALSHCDKRSRLIQQLLLDKLRWRQ